jgi:hypothetical protein
MRENMKNITAKENMLRILRGELAEWIPIVIYTDPFNHPDIDTMPADLAEKFRKDVGNWGKCAELSVILSEYLGVNEYILNAQCPINIVLGNGVEERYHDEGIRTIYTPSGTLTQKSESHGGEAYVTKRLVNGRDDLIKLTEYFESWQFELNHDAVADIRMKKDFIKDNGLIWNYSNGTPLGMMYRVYSDITDLIYLIADCPDEVKTLFATMEKKYLQIFEMMLREVPEIDIIVGMDDTSTTLISPDMFDEFNVELTNKRADLIHKYGKFYMHHSCGLIHDLLPSYRKTRMDAVHAFTTPPIGNVTFPEGRKLLGDKISIATRVVEPHMLKPDADRKEITAQMLARFQDVKKAGRVILYLNTPSSQYGVDFMKMVLSEARKYQKL